MGWLYLVAMLSVVPLVGFLATGGSVRGMLQYVGTWLACVALIAAIGGVLVLITLSAG